jgi:probable F420-dependent oxidoreductase
MKFGVVLPQTKEMDLRDVTTVAAEAESAGYASLWVYERLMFPLEPRDGLYGVPGLAWLDGYRYTAEPLTVLTLAAAVTQTVRLGTSVLVAGLHSSQELARTLATLDRATGGGRVIAGLAGGWSQDEFLAAGVVAFEHRGLALDETIDALTALWGPDPVTYQDSRTRVDNALVSPKPAATIPIMLGGGNTTKALNRIARKADGWIPTGIPAAVIGQQWQAIRDLAAGYGRPADAIQLVPLVHVMLSDSDAGQDRMPFQGSIAQVVDDVAEVVEIGADEIIIAFHGLESTKDQIVRSEELITALTDAGL